MSPFEPLHNLRYRDRQLCALVQHYHSFNVMSKGFSVIICSAAASQDQAPYPGKSQQTLQETLAPTQGSDMPLLTLTIRVPVVKI